ncbi:hypothetical protein EV421DRAFT_1736401 [Armillaria borealis]|uniref:Uncharacterized protein n=1 Tax=Armillaria borealis TaxID=47425 RepID=A0AA39JG48_9AGAR|nr:hypothetical protein EV421DRAFT_1736401 [Armillaria borealis]
MTTPSDAGVSDKDIQTYLDADFNSQILGFFVYGQESKVSNNIFEHVLKTEKFLISISLRAVKKISKARIFMGCIITALYIFAVINVILSWIYVNSAYVLTTSLRARYDFELSLLFEIIDTTATALNLIIADCTIIWRCWVVWAHDWRVIILPIFFVVGEIVCGGIGVVSEFMTEGKIYVTDMHWAVALMAATVGTNILCTALIVGRIIYVARGHRGIMGGIRTYRGVIEILVESAALYSIIYVVLMILYPLEGYEYLYIKILSYPVTGIAPTLIILRVTSGQGRPEESSQETQSSLHFQTSRGSTIETVTDGGEEDTRQANTEGTAPVPSGSVEQV